MIRTPQERRSVARPGREHDITQPARFSVNGVQLPWPDKPMYSLDRSPRPELGTDACRWRCSTANGALTVSDKATVFRQS